MAEEPDEDALSWGDEADSSHVAAPASAGGPPVAIASGTSSVLLVFYGVIAGVYLLFSIGWGIASVRTPNPVEGVFPVIMYEFGEFLAIAAPALWLLSVLVLARGARPAIRVLWLVLGIIVLVPWPFVVVG